VSNTIEVSFPDGTALEFRPPTRGEMMRFNDKISSDKRSKHGALEELLLACLVSDRELGKATVEEYPASVPTIAIELQKLAGSEVEIRVKN